MTIDGVDQKIAAIHAGYRYEFKLPRPPYFAANSRPSFATGAVGRGVSW
jgi:hypothetical protein